MPSRSKFCQGLSSQFWSSAALLILTSLPSGFVHQSPRTASLWKRSSFQGLHLGTRFCPLGRGPRLRFPHNLALGAPAGRLTFPGILLPSASVLLSVVPLHTTEPSDPASSRDALVFPSVSPLGVSSLATPGTFPSPRPSVSLPGPFLLLRSLLHPDPVPPPSSLLPSPLTGQHPPPGAPSPNSLGLAARPLSQQSCSLGSSACGRLTSQSRHRAAVGAPPRRLLGSVVLESRRLGRRPLLENYRLSQGLA